MPGTKWTSKKRIPFGTPEFEEAKKKSKEKSNRLTIYHVKPKDLPEGMKPFTGIICRCDGYWERVVADVITKREDNAAFIAESCLIPQVLWLSDEKGQPLMKPPDRKGDIYRYRAFVMAWEEGMPELTKDNIEDWAVNVFIKGFKETEEGDTKIIGTPSLAQNWYLEINNWCELFEKKYINKMLTELYQPTKTPYEQFTDPVNGKGLLYSIYKYKNIPIDIMETFRFTKKHVEQEDYDRYKNFLEQKAKYRGSNKKRPRSITSEANNTPGTVVTTSDGGTPDSQQAHAFSTPTQNPTNTGDDDDSDNDE